MSFFASSELTRRRAVSRFAFRSRLTLAERAAIELASLDNPNATAAQRQQAATLRVLMGDLMSLDTVDLDHPELASGLQVLESSGLIAAGRSAQLLADAQPNELP